MYWRPDTSHVQRLASTNSPSSVSISAQLSCCHLFIVALVNYKIYLKYSFAVFSILSEYLIFVYKTWNTYGPKHIKINDEKFIKHFKNLKIDDKKPIFVTKDLKPVGLSYLSDLLCNYSIDKLREANVFKIIVKHLIDTKDFAKLDEYVKSRGTSMAEIMKSYNIQRVNKTAEPEPEPEPEPNTED